jgi:hypothetical protein
MDKNFFRFELVPSLYGVLIGVSFQPELVNYFLGANLVVSPTFSFIRIVVLCAASVILFFHIRNRLRVLRKERENLQPQRGDNKNDE